MVISEFKINNFNIHIYGIFIIISLIAGIIYCIKELRNSKIKKEHIFYFVLIIITFSLIGGKLFTMITTKDNTMNFLNAGLSSYGGAIGIFLGVLYYELINPHNKVYIKTAIMSLPLIYGIAKLGCFFVGCCYGLPYEGFLSVTYPHGLNEPLIPVQLIESILFIILFIMLQSKKIKKSRYAVEITIISSAFLKFLLDFLRYDHLKEIISLNQIISIVIIIVTIILIIIKKKRK